MQNHIRFVVQHQRDLAATAVWGTQMLHTVGKQKFDGVTGMWVRQGARRGSLGDALKHANFTGIARTAACSRSRATTRAARAPRCARSPSPCCSTSASLAVPGQRQEILDYGLHGCQMSRLAGVWMGMKIVTNVADGTGTANVSPSA